MNGEFTQCWIKPLKQFSRTTKIQIRKIFFTPREVDILSCYISGRSPKHIAGLLSLSTNTIEVHTRNISQKIQCQNREGIITFIEKSDHYQSLKNHYFNLLIPFKVKEILKKIGPHLKDRSLCIFLCGKTAHQYRGSVEAYLSFLGKNHQINLLNHLPSQATDKYHLYLLDAYFLHKEEDSDDPRSRVILSPKMILPNTVNLKSLNMYPLEIGFLIFLKNLIPKEIQKTIDDLVEEIIPLTTTLISNKNQNDTKPRGIKNNIINQSKRRVLYYRFAFFILICGCVVSLNHFYPNLPTISNIEFIDKNKILVRHGELSNLHEIFKDKSIDQNTVAAIVGIGGSGKTTLAYLYGKKYAKSLVWKINAESIKSLEESIQYCASTLSDINEVNKQEYSRIIKEFVAKERSRKLKHFVQKYLRKNPGWILIYDDLKCDLGQIQPFLFIDKELNGEGKILITSRNANLKISLPYKNVLTISSLSKKEKFDLFKQINPDFFHKKENLRPFEKALGSLPPFPLDIAIAAHYMKQGHTEFSRYIEDIKNQDSSISTAQKNILKIVGNYTKTRNYIFSLSIKNIISSNPIFSEMLFLLSLIQSRNIPIKFLEDIYGVENTISFITLLKNHSFVTNVSHREGLKLFTIHDSIHSYLLTCLNKLLEKNTRILFHKKIFNFLKIFLEKSDSRLIPFDNFIIIRYLLPHLTQYKPHHKFFSKNDLLTIRILIILKKVRLRSCSEDDIKFLNDIKDNKSLAPLLKSDIYSYLGLISVRLDEENATSFFEKSIKILKSRKINYPHRLIKQITFIAWSEALNKGKYRKALLKIEEALRISNNIKNPFAIAFCKGHLGWVHGLIGNHDVGEKLLRESLLIHKQLDIPQGWVKQHLGKILLSKGQYSIAQKLLNESLASYEYHGGKNYNNIGEIKLSLGLLKGFLGNYKAAHKELEEGHRIINILYRSDHFFCGIAFQYKGIVFFLEKKYKESRVFLEKSLETFSKNNHPKKNLSLEYLKRIKENDKPSHP